MNILSTYTLSGNTGMEHSHIDEREKRNVIFCVIA